MHYFLDPDFNSHTGLLSEDESRHALKALRINAGDHIVVGNGKGYRYTCKTELVGKKQLMLAVLDEELIPPPSNLRTIALAPLKNVSRYEWFMEKAAELDVDLIVPLLTARTEKPRINRDRLQRILLAAAKQSQRAYLPELAQLTPFADVIKKDAGSKIIAHCMGERERKPLTHILQENTTGDVLILVGPEGDFSADEVEDAVKAGFAEADLGPLRLRTETAGVYCAAMLAALNPRKDKTRYEM